MDSSVFIWRTSDVSAIERKLDLIVGIWDDEQKREIGVAHYLQLIF
jgi:hypothetical protein